MKLLPPYFVAKYLATQPVLQRAAEEFWRNAAATILVGQDRIPVPFNATQLLLRSGFYQRLTEDSAEPPKELLEAFAIRLDDPEFLLGWLIANGVMPLPAEPEFQNIYCDYLMISGYKPAPEQRRPVPPTMEELQKQLATAKQRLAAEKERRKLLAEEKAKVDCAIIMQEFQAKIEASIQAGPVPDGVFEMSYANMTPELEAQLKASKFKVTKQRWPAGKRTIILDPSSSSCVVL